MFFTPALLAKRDSGFGLLWLAATLGSKSTFKKLPRRSVLTADISQLCDLIAQPAEPLALRLSSNLMVGVARVYKVKQDMFLTDVSNCASSLRKVVQEWSSGLENTSLQMAHPSAKLSTLTLGTDLAGRSGAFDFDALVADWDDYLNIKEVQIAQQDDDEYFEAGPAKPKPSATELRRAAHTLEEDYNHLLSGSFDNSFSALGSASFDISSSQVDPGFLELDDPFFPDNANFDPGFGDELALELGEGWGGSTQQQVLVNDATNLDFGDMTMDVEPAFASDAFDFAAEAPTTSPPIQERTPSGIKSLPGLNQDPPLLDVTRELSPTGSFSRLLLSQDAVDFLQGTPAPDDQQPPSKPRKKKRARLLLDAETELTDAELKTARAQYLQNQMELRQAMVLKKIDKNQEKIIDDLIWRAPSTLHAPDLIDFWQENFKVQVEARTGLIRLHTENLEPPQKRRRTDEFDCDEKENEVMAAPEEYEPTGFQMDMDYDQGFMQDGFGDVVQPLHDTRHSSEEPGQARQLSQPMSLSGAKPAFQFGAELEGHSSQRSSLFPWDHAGFASSSSGLGGQVRSEGVVIDKAEVKLRGSSVSRRDSSLGPSQKGSGGLSPARFALGSDGLDGDFAFDVENQQSITQSETQKSDVNLITLERNSYNFLEYARMEQQGLAPAEELHFSTVAPVVTSTRHVAAAAFYHCLVLATKDLVRLSQPEPYGNVTIQIL